MSFEIAFVDPPGGTTDYFNLIKDDNTWYNTALDAFENFNAAHITDYDIAASETGSTGYFTGDMPASAQITKGSYRVVARRRLGGSPAQSDTIVGIDTVCWTGSAVRYFNNVLLAAGEVHGGTNTRLVLNDNNDVGPPLDVTTTGSSSYDAALFNSINQFSINAPAGINGNLQGNVSGSVGSVTGNVGGNVGGNVLGVVVGSVGSVASVVDSNVTQIVGAAGAANNLKSSLNDVAGAVPWFGIIDQGTAQSATSSTLVLRAASAFGDNTLAGATLMVFGSTQNYWQQRVIRSNVLSTDTVTVDTWSVTPSGTITYKIFGTNAQQLDAAGIRSAVGLASANLDTQFSNIAANVWAFVTEGAFTAVQILRGLASFIMGKASGGGAGPVIFRDLGDTKNRISQTVDANGNRSAVTRDLT